MEVILLEKVENLGDMGDRVKVRPGFGRNFLLPKGKATLATPDNIRIFEARREELEKKQAEERAAAEARAGQLAELALRIVAKAGSEGKLFGSIGTIDIAEACTEAGVNVQRSEVRLPEGPIRVLGEHEVELHLHTDVTVPVRIQVVGEDGATGPSLVQPAAEEGGETGAAAEEVADERPAATDSSVETDGSAATGSSVERDGSAATGSSAAG